MRVRSRPDERQRKNREDSFKIQLFSTRKAACALEAERSILTGKRGWFLFSPRLRAEDNDTQHRLPTRQMGWPALGCNQQDPWGASERPVTTGLPAWFPTHRGAGRKYGVNSTLYIKKFRLPSLTANPCGVDDAHAAPVCCQCGWSTS